MGKLISTIFVLFCLCTYGQEEEKLSNSSKWVASNYFGTVILEIEDSLKTRGNVFGGSFGKSFTLNQNWFLEVSLGHLRVNTDFENSGDAMFQSYSYLHFPILIGFSPVQTKNIQLFVNVGSYFSHLYRSKVETISSGERYIIKNLGSNFGFQMGIGISHDLNSHFKFRIGLLSKKDLTASYKNEHNAKKIKEMHAIQFTLGVIF